MAELTKVTRQREDLLFIQVLNKIREGNCDVEVEINSKSRFFS